MTKPNEQINRPLIYDQPSLNSIWDFIAKADTKRQIIGDIKSKEKKIFELPRVCGSCDLWMTSQCKREIKIKVSDSMSICSDFKQTKWVTDLIGKLHIEVSELKIALNSNP
jgi:hypothetical protein